MITDDDKQIIKDVIAPLVHQGDLSLLLGAGFSMVNKAKSGLPLPSGDALIDQILTKAGKTRGPKTTLKDAYQLGKREITAFDDFLADSFTASAVFPWQEQIFHYPWSRIYTTNIDNVLNVAVKQAEAKGLAAGDFRFFNYVDPSLTGELLGNIPVISVHGTCLQVDKGFIFSNIEYAVAAVKVFDWHRELAAKALAGGLIVVGNQLDETDLDIYIAQRESDYPSDRKHQNWIVLKDPDPIKTENYRASRFHVFDCKAEEFFLELYKYVRPRTIGDIVLESIPALKIAAQKKSAMSWFKRAFSPVLISIENARLLKGVLRHFLTGREPEWFYVVNHAHADLTAIGEMTQKIGDIARSVDTGVTLLNILGQSGSGKTTSIRAALYNLSATYKYIYEFKQGAGMEPDMLCHVLETFTDKAIFVFYSASEYYYAINLIAKRIDSKNRPHCLFLLEDRTNDYKKSKRHIDFTKSATFNMPSLSHSDARALALKLETAGVVFENFSNLPLSRRAEVIVNKERGFSGDLLSALFSLSSNENFEQKLFAEYYGVKDDLAKKIFDVVVICHNFGFPVPISYASAALNITIDDTVAALENDLNGVLISSPGASDIRCRHRKVAEYYFQQCVTGNGNVELLVGLLSALSRQFSVEQIRHHPLPYLIYKNIIPIEFMGEYFPASTCKQDTEATLHAAQSFFGRDGLFWLQYGRYYRNYDELDPAIDCFRTGLRFFDSFQTSHALGQALVERYIEGGCSDDSFYDEGVALLDEQLAKRGSSDPYPLTTLLSLLIKILSTTPQNNKALAKAKDCINFGLRHFKEDETFISQWKRFSSITNAVVAPH